MLAGDEIPGNDRARRGSQRARCDNVSFDPRDKLLVIAEPT